MKSHLTFMHAIRAFLIWGVVVGVIITPIYYSLTSPLLAWRDSIYIGAAFAGVLALAVLLFQPLLMLGVLPAISNTQERLFHRGFGIVLLALVLVHIIGLWIVSPPDVIDVLLFNSPTPFSVWGALAMWAVFASFIIAVTRRKLRLRFGLRMWRIAHITLGTIIVVGSVVHAIQIEGTMELISKSVLCGLVVLATIMVLIKHAKNKA